MKFAHGGRRPSPPVERINLKKSVIILDLSCAIAKVRTLDQEKKHETAMDFDCHSPSVSTATANGQTQLLLANGGLLTYDGGITFDGREFILPDGDKLETAAAYWKSGSRSRGKRGNGHGATAGNDTRRCSPRGRRWRNFIPIKTASSWKTTGRMCSCPVEAAL
jgi:hypothetical protein